MKNTILKWESIGIIVIVVFGALFHFMFEILNYWSPAGVIFPVNESVWEHLIIAFMPSILFAIIEYPFLNKRTNNFFFAKALMPISAANDLNINEKELPKSNKILAILPATRKQPGIAQHNNKPHKLIREKY